MRFGHVPLGVGLPASHLFPALTSFCQVAPSLHAFYGSHCYSPMPHQPPPHWPQVPSLLFHLPSLDHVSFLTTTCRYCTLGSAFLALGTECHYIHVWVFHVIPPPLDSSPLRVRILLLCLFSFFA